RDVAIVDAGRRKSLSITVEVPVDDMANLGERVELPSGPAAALGGAQDGSRASIWPAIYPRLLELIRAHRSTIVFVNSRRPADRALRALGRRGVQGSDHPQVPRRSAGDGGGRRADAQR